LEQGFEIVQNGNSPILHVHGLQVKLIFEASNGGE
jgi:hypothetical protein